MKATILKQETGQGEYLLFRGDVDRANPVEHLLESYVNRQMIVGAALARAQGIISSKEEEEQARMILLRKAMREWPAVLTEIKSRAIPDYYLKLFGAEDKKTQVSLLKGANITVDQLTALAVRAGEMGFTYSRYRVERKPTNFDTSQLPPLFVRQEDGSFDTVGQATAGNQLSQEKLDKQMNHLLGQRKVTVATFFDRGDEWHCFFGTYRAFEGKENHRKDGVEQPHMHYISDKWGTVTRQDVLKGIGEGKYPSTNVHIDLLDGNSANEGTENDKPLPAAFSSTGTGIPEGAWLGVSGSLYTHFYPATKNVAACKRYDDTYKLRAAWSSHERPNKAQCTACIQQITPKSDG